MNQSDYDSLRSVTTEKLKSYERALTDALMRIRDLERRLKSTKPQPDLNHD